MYKGATAKSKKIVKEQKRKSWRNYCSSITIHTTISSIWNKVRCIKNGSEKTSLYGKVEISQDWLEDYADSIAVASNSHRPYTETDNSTLHTHILDELYTLEELHTAIKCNSSDTAPGPDNITYSMIKHLPDTAMKVLLYIYNNIWSSTEWIDEWQEQYIIPIKKPGKNPCEIESYRPIALTSCLIKTLERIMKNKLEWYLESNKLIPSNLFAYRKGKSTSDAIFSLTNNIYTAFKNNNILSTTFLDISGAFDNVCIPLLLEKMSRLNIPSSFIKKIDKLFSNRKITIAFDGKFSNSRHIYSGLPQGSILSPILFNIYTSDLCQIFSPSIKTVQ